MKSYVNDLTGQHGQTLLFVGALGDNFYGTVGSSGHGFQSVWKEKYGDLTNYKWLATLGNHDFGDHDPNLQGCSGAKGIQMTHGGSTWHLPYYNYHYTVPGANMEVISLDTNGGWCVDHSGHGCHIEVDECGKESLRQKWKDGLEYLKERARASQHGTTTLLIQHYPEYTGIPQTLKQTWDQHGGKGTFVQAYGHTHENKMESGHNIMSGGGGGYHSDNGNLYGFVAVHLDDAGGIQAPEIINVRCR